MCSTFLIPLLAPPPLESSSFVEVPAQLFISPSNVTSRSNSLHECPTVGNVDLPCSLTDKFGCIVIPNDSQYLVVSAAIAVTPEPTTNSTPSIIHDEYEPEANDFTPTISSPPSISISINTPSSSPKSIHNAPSTPTMEDSILDGAINIVKKVVAYKREKAKGEYTKQYLWKNGASIIAYGNLLQTLVLIAFIGHSPATSDTTGRPAHQLARWFKWIECFLPETPVVDSTQHYERWKYVTEKLAKICGTFFDSEEGSSDWYVIFHLCIA